MRVSETGGGRVLISGALEAVGIVLEAVGAVCAAFVAAVAAVPAAVVITIGVVVLVGGLVVVTAITAPATGSTAGEITPIPNPVPNPTGTATATATPRPGDERHRGTIQIQGGDITPQTNPGAKKNMLSVSWGQDTPPAAGLGLAWLDSLWAKLGRTQQRDRKEAYQGARARIQTAPASGGLPQRLFD